MRIAFFVSQSSRNAEKKFSAAGIKQVAMPCVKRFSGDLAFAEFHLQTNAYLIFLRQGT
jgi:hypothetical protein